jgi:hypothetical protein
LQVAERVATDPLDFQIGLDLLAKEIGQRPGTGELNVVMFVAYLLTIDGGRPG